MPERDAANTSDGGEVCTPSGIPLKPFYTPQDVSGIEYDVDLGDPGTYPYTRGVYRQGYRGKEWTRRQQTGFGSPEDTNKRIRLYLQQGFTGANVNYDLPTHVGVDPDHPRSEGEVGHAGVSACCLRDFERLIGDLPIDTLSWVLESGPFNAPVTAAFLYVLAERRGLAHDKLPGTVVNDPITPYWVGCYPEDQLAVPLAMKLSTDITEFCMRHMPRVHSTYVDSYNIREQGVDAIQEGAFLLAKAVLFLERAIKRGLSVDEVASRFTFFLSTSIDFFEEIAKHRALRKMWAKIVKERFGGQTPRSMQFRFAVETAGSAMTHQQILNNIARITSQVMATALGSAQAMTPACYDEAVCIPSERAGIVSARIQQIVTYELGITRVADPLAGSYFVESLTKTIEERIGRLLQDIEDRGGLLAAITSGWVEGERVKAMLRRQEQLENKERIVVGVNAFVEDEAEDLSGQYEFFRANQGSIDEHIARLKAMKAERDQASHAEALRNLHSEALRGEDHNLMPAIIRAVKADATLGEITGVIRVANGLHYDPFHEIESPISL